MVGAHRKKVWENILAHPLLVKAAENLKPRVDELIAWLVPSGQRPSKPRPLALGESYHVGVLWYGISLSNIPKWITVCEAFLGKIPSSSYLTRVGLSRQDYILSRYQVHAVLMVAGYDLALSLCNSVFNLDDPTVQVREQSLLNNEWVQRAGISYELKRLGNLVKRHRETGYGILSQTEKREIGVLNEVLFLDSTVNLWLAAERPISLRAAKRRFLHQTFRLEVSKLVSDIESERGNLIKSVRKLLDKLLPIYDKWTQVISPVNY